MFALLCLGVAVGCGWYARNNAASIVWYVLKLRVKARSVYHVVQKSLLGWLWQSETMEFLDADGACLSQASTNHSEIRAILERDVETSTVLCRVRTTAPLNITHSNHPHVRPGLGGVHILGPQIVVEEGNDRSVYDLEGKVPIRDYVVYGSHLFGRPLLRYWLRKHFDVEPSPSALCSVEYMDSTLKTVKLPETKCLEIVKTMSAFGRTTLEEREIKTF